MDFHSPVTYDYFDLPKNNQDSSEFSSERYLEYRRLVFEELASEYEKLSTVDKQQRHRYEPDLITEIPREFELTDYPMSPLSPLAEFNYVGKLQSDNSELHDNDLISIEGLPEDLSPSQQPTWDDSDLQPEPIITSPLLKQPGYTSEEFGGNFLTLSEDELNDNQASHAPLRESESLLDSQLVVDTIPAMHWTELESQLQNMTRYHQEKSNVTTPSPRLQSHFSPSSKRRSSRSSLLKQKNDRETIRQKLSMGDPDIDSLPFGSDKPWYPPRLERSYSGNNQNLQICYINDSCSSSDNEESGRSRPSSDSKTSPSTKNSSTGRSSPTSSPVLSSPGFGIRRNFAPYRMSSSSSTVSLSSTSSMGHHTSSSSLPGDGEIINIRSSFQAEHIPKAKSQQENLELQARIAITQAHQEARRQAEEERKRNRKGSKSSLDRLLRVPLDDATRLKVKNRSLNQSDCVKMTIGQLQVILNDMHTEKEGLNSELMVILEMRDELRMEQDAKLVDVDDMKAMLSVTGPETTV